MAGPACPDVLQKNVTKAFLTASRIVREEENKSRLLLTGVSPQTKAANMICQKLHDQMFIEKAPGYHLKCHEKLPSEAGNVHGTRRSLDKLVLF